VKVNRLPFALVLFSSFIPITGAIFGISVFHVPAAVAVGTGIVAYSTTRTPVYLGHTWLYSLTLMFALLSIQVLSGRGFVILAAGGYVLVFGFIFYGLFALGRGITLDSVIRGGSTLNKFFLIGLAIELIIVLGGGQGSLEELLNAGSGGGYKTYNPADLPRSFGLFQNQGGLNSILLGSQIAGMLSLFAAIWFMGLRSIETRRTKNSFFWILSSIFMLLVTINGTVLLLTVAAAGLYLIFGVKRNKTFWMVGGLLVVVGLFWLTSAGYILPRIFSDERVNLAFETRMELENRGLYERANGTTLNYYIEEFRTPLNVYAALGWADQMIGVGAEYLRTTDELVGGDFAIGASLLATGAIWIAVLMTTTTAIGLAALRVPAGTSEEMRRWSVLSMITGLMTILWLMSTVHYGQAFTNPGAIPFFAASLALAAYSRGKVRTLK
jgi:hypothetical protein